MVDNCKELPAGYKESFKINLQNDKKTAVIVNVFGLVIAVAMLVPAVFIWDWVALFKEGFMLSIKCFAVAIGAILYMVLHELVHGIFMKAYSGVKPKYGFTGMYAYAGSSAYFNKKCYIIIALAPVVIWGIVLAVLQIFLPGSWALIAYVIQIINISGAAGDIYVTAKMLKCSDDILVNDTGTDMTVYEL